MRFPPKGGGAQAGLKAAQQEPPDAVFHGLFTRAVHWLGQQSVSRSQGGTGCGAGWTPSSPLKELASP
eukprot:scaffold124847_cov54-Phaeocystis_antarctica.AAC.6